MHRSWGEVLPKELNRVAAGLLIEKKLAEFQREASCNQAIRS